MSLKLKNTNIMLEKRLCSDTFEQDKRKTKKPKFVIQDKYPDLKTNSNSDHKNNDGEKLFSSLPQDMIMHISQFLDFENINVKLVTKQSFWKPSKVIPWTIRILKYKDEDVNIGMKMFTKPHLIVHASYCILGGILSLFLKYIHECVHRSHGMEWETNDVQIQKYGYSFDKKERQFIESFCEKRQIHIYEFLNFDNYWINFRSDWFYEPFANTIENEPYPYRFRIYPTKYAFQIPNQESYEKWMEKNLSPEALQKEMFKEKQILAHPAFEFEFNIISINENFTLNDIITKIKNGYYRKGSIFVNTFHMKKWRDDIKNAVLEWTQMSKNPMKRLEFTLHLIPLDKMNEWIEFLTLSIQNKWFNEYYVNIECKKFEYEIIVQTIFQIFHSFNIVPFVRWRYHSLNYEYLETIGMYSFIQVVLENESVLVHKNLKGIEVQNTYCVHSQESCISYILEKAIQTFGSRFRIELEKTNGFYYLITPK